MTVLSNFFSTQQLTQVANGTIPQHVAIIMDGNRRWGAATTGEGLDGHPAGANVVLRIVEAARDLGVKTLTLYAFSTENWNRPPLEVASVMTLIESYLRAEEQRMIDQGVRLGTIGLLSRLPKSLQQTIRHVKQATAHCRDIDMVLALNYGARDDITRACRSIASRVAAGELPYDEIDESLIASYLDTAPWGDPDLLIRPGGEHRISNYLLWQLSYSELIFTDTYWPAFTPNNLLNAIIEFQQRERRRGA